MTSKTLSHSITNMSVRWTLNGAPCQGPQPHWHTQDGFSVVVFLKRVGSLGAVRETPKLSLIS